jgi:hypothetical protein
MSQAQEKLLNGLEEICRISANNDSIVHANQLREKLLDTLKEKQQEIKKSNSSLLCSAFLNINGAIEERFRDLLKSNPNISSEELDRTNRPNSKWVELTNLMQKYYGLSDDEKFKIMIVNGFRASYGYDGYVVRQYAVVEGYAQFVRKLMNKYSSD